MPSTYSTSLRLELQADGENAGTWGQKTNTNLGTLLEQSIAGWATIAVSGATVLTALNGLSDQARNAVLNLTNGGVAAPFTVTVPAHSKVYVFDNQSGQTATITGGGTTFAIPTGKRSAVYVDTSGNVAELVNGSDAFAVNNLTVATSVLSTRPVVGGSANAITLTYSPTPGSYINGQSFEFIATAANTGATTVNVNGLGAKNVFRKRGAGAAACVGGEIQSGDIVEIEYDGTQFQLGAAPPAIPKIVVFTASGTYTPTTGMRAAEIMVKGGGASGGGSSVVAVHGGGGGEGETVWKMLTAADIGASQTVTIGAGGAVVALNTNASGNTGGTTSLGSLVTAIGGTNDAASGNNGGQGGTGGHGGTGGDYSMPGAHGQAGADAGGATIAINSAGGGQGGADAATAGRANSGGGGGGGSTSAASGAGGSGICVVREYF